MKPKAFNDLPDEMRAKYDFDFSAAEHGKYAARLKLKDQI